MNMFFYMNAYMCVMETGETSSLILRSVRECRSLHTEKCQLERECPRFVLQCEFSLNLTRAAIWPRPHGVNLAIVDN